MYRRCTYNDKNNLRLLFCSRLVHGQNILFCRTKSAITANVLFVEENTTGTHDKKNTKLK